MRIIIYTGKGGTGKTVTSCSTAIKLAEHDHKTLVISSDPAHTLGDAFMISNIGYEMQKILPNLEALQIDPVTEMKKQFDTILSYMASIFSAKGIDETLAYEIAMLPGMTQLFSLLKIEELVKLKSFDAIVIDMPASGDALRYLYFPKLVGSIGRKLTGLAGMFGGVARIFQPLSQISMPSKGVLQSEVDLIDRLQYLSVINKIMPHQSSDQYYANWAEFQQRKVEEAKANFYPLPLRQVFLHDTELRGLDMLTKNGELLFGKEDPGNIYYQGSAFNFLTEGNSLQLKVKVPFTEKDNFDLERYGDQLTIKVKSPVGYIVNIISLPSVTLGMNLVKAKLDGDELKVMFGKSI